MIKLDALLYDFLVESSGMPVGEYRVLTDTNKSDTIITIANSVLNSIKQKMEFIDTSIIDRSRGEIKNFFELKTIQDVINRVTSLAQAYAEDIHPLVPLYLKEVTKAIYNLNKYSGQFKEAYRSKKTFLIMNYQSVILSIISALSYLVSVTIDFKDTSALRLKPQAQVEAILPYKSIVEFNKSIDNGLFDSAIRDITTLREFYVEYTVDELSTIYESVEIAPLLDKGISAFTHFFGGQRNGVIFKVLGVVMMLLSLRDIFYTLSSSRIKLGEKLQNLKTFLNPDQISSTSALARFITFNNKNATESVYASNAAKQEITDENRSIIQTAKEKPMQNMDQSNDFIPEITTTNEPVADTNNIFSQFNF